MQVVFDRDKKIEELEEMLKHLIDEKDIQSVKFTIEYLKRMECVQLLKSNGNLVDADVTKIIDIIENEKKCVLRAGKEECDRDCLHCDLLRDSNDIIQSYDYVLDVLNNILWEKSFWEDFIKTGSNF